MHRRGRKGKSKSESAGKREDNDKEEEGYDGEAETEKEAVGGCIIKQGDNKVVRISGLGRGVVKRAWRITEERGLIKMMYRSVG